MTRQELLNQVKSLPRQEQLDFAMEVWDLLDVGQDELALGEPLASELDRRMAAADADPQPEQDVLTLKEQLLRGEF